MTEAFSVIWEEIESLPVRGAWIEIYTLYASLM